MIKVFQYGTAIALDVVYLSAEIPPPVVNSLCLVSILIFGIPHGAIDHRIHLSTSSDSRLARYVLKYILIAVGYIFWWVLDPSKALFIFVLLSAYHFGQELLEDNGVHGSSLLTRMVWGSAILIAPMVFHFNEVLTYIDVVAHGSWTGIGNWQYYLPAFILIMTILSLGQMYRKNTIDQKQVVKLSIFLFFILISQATMSFIPAFTLYFVLFHSLNAFRHQYTWLKSNQKQYSLGHFISDLVGFSLLAILGILSLLWFLKPESQASLITYFFILVSLITLPHAITLDQFYRFRSKPHLSGQLK